MNKTLTLALAMSFLAIAALPSASAIYCAGGPDVTRNACNYVFSGEAGRDAGATVVHVSDQATETAQFIWDTYGDDLPLP